VTTTSETPPPLFGTFPTDGIWTGLGLGRTQFFAILALSLALFVFVDGPVWQHVHDAHFWRITVSYLAIPVAVAAALAANHTTRLSLLIGASAVLALIKLVATATGMAR
jgi:hypothetical protein